MECNLKIALEFDFIKDPIETKIIINDEILVKEELHKNNYEFDCHGLENNVLKIYMQNKGINDTLLNDAGVIIQDTFIKIKSIMINNRKLRYAVSDLGNVYYNDGTQHLKNNYLAKNGYYELQFTLPIRTFLQQYYSTWNTYKPVDVASEIKVIDNFLKTL